MISIIVPVYNVEKYLRQCINSVIAQSYKDWELILIDDGSPDRSGDICDEYSVKDNRIKVIHKKNEGVSIARNNGLDKASGEYVIFLDADDFWTDPDALKLLLEKALRDNLDIVRGEYVRVDEKGAVIEENKDNKERKETVCDSFTMVKDIINREFFSVLFLFKKETIENIRFDSSMVFGEDIYFLINLFCNNLSCGYIPITFYGYRQLNTSASKKVNVLNVINSFSFCDKYYQCALKAYDKNLADLYVYYSIMMYYWTLETVSSNEYRVKYKEIDAAASLDNLRRTVFKRISLIKDKKFPLQLYVSPKMGICLFRLRWKVGHLLRTLNLR